MGILEKGGNGVKLGAITRHADVKPPRPSPPAKTPHFPEQVNAPPDGPAEKEPAPCPVFFS